MNPLAPAARRVRHRAATPDADAGFTVLEVMVAIVIITIVMTAMAAFFVNSAGATENQSQRQDAVQVGQDAIEQARALDASTLLNGRDKTSSDALWAKGQDASSTTAFPGVAPYLTSVAEAYDTSNPANVGGQPAGYSAALPTNGVTQTVGAITYTQNWFLGSCYSAQATNSGACSATQATGTTLYIQVVAAVTWKAKQCRSNVNQTCSYLTVTRISPTADPLFGANQSAPKPRIVNPGNQKSDAGQAVSLSITLTGGTAPITWTTPSNLPAGLTFTGGSSGATITGSASTAGTYSVLLGVSDAFGFASTARFTWTVSPALNLANPGPQTWALGASRSLALSTSGGLTAYTYKIASGTLPAGLSFATDTGTVSGTPTATNGTGVTVAFTVTDANGMTDTESCVWKTVAKLTMTGASAETTDVGQPDSKTLTPAGGNGGYSWNVTGKASWMTGTTNSSGQYVITGTPPSGSAGTSSITATLSDNAGNTTTSTFTWTVYNALALSAPTGARSSAYNTTLTVTSTATGGDGNYTYSATNLPTGLSINSTSGQITGKPTQAYRYLTTVSVADGTGASASVSFVWTITGDMTTNLTERTDASGRAITTTTATATGGPYSTYYWVASGLPAGVSMSTGGQLSGTPSTAGSYQVTVTTYSGYASGNKFYYSDLATTMFTWTVS